MKRLAIAVLLAAGGRRQAAGGRRRAPVRAAIEAYIPPTYFTSN